MTQWEIERIVNFEPGDVCMEGFVHFGFHDRQGRQYALFHREHFMGLLSDDKLEWTVAEHAVMEGTPNIRAKLRFPTYVDSMPDGSLIVSNFGDARLYRIDVAKMRAELFVDGPSLGMTDAGNCVVDAEWCVWVNEVTGYRIRRFDSSGKPLLSLGNGSPGFQADPVDFSEARFNWIYDIRRGPDDNIYVLDSRNFAVRVIDVQRRLVQTLAGTGEPGYGGDSGDARRATFGGSPEARFDGPISLSLDEEGDIVVGDRFNHVVRMIEKKDGSIHTIAGNPESVPGKKNPRGETNPSSLNLPEISSMDYYGGRLFIPTDITSQSGDLIVMRRRSGRGRH